MITSFDAFVHIKGADDCSLDNQWLKKVFAKLHNKWEKNHNFFELSIIVHGCIEFLTIAGLTLIKGEPIDAFLGSSVKPLKKKFVVDGDRLTSEIYIRRHHQDIVHSERLLRQYYKRDSCKLWSFHAKSTYDVGFFPINPLDSQNHSSVSSMQIILQSFIINSIARRHVNHLELDILLQRVQGSEKFLKKFLKLDEFSGSTFADLYGRITKQGKWKETIKVLKMLVANEMEANEISFDWSKKEIVTNKAIILKLAKGGFLKSLSDLNEKNSELVRLRLL